MGLLLLGAPCARAADSEAARVIILANSSDPDSVRLARAYADLRSVPTENIIALKMPLGEGISWPDFVSTIQQPLQDELIKRKWIDGIAMDLADNLGRRKIAMSGHHISYLVVCRGVPLRVMHEQALYTPAPPVTNRSEFRTIGAAIDSELSLLAQSGFPAAGFVPNPFFRNDDPSLSEQGQVVRVSRLDGPTYEDALGLVESALAAEKQGLVGRAYIDLGGIHPDGEQWLRLAAEALEAAGFDLEVDRAGATLPATSRADAAAFYLGWYTAQINGPFVLPGYRFAPGAIALHIHSFSAQSLRSENGGGWTGPLVARGVAGTFGNVYEPYLQLTHQPHLIVRALLRGETLGAAAYYALPALSWQGIVLGDPLYRPAIVPLEQQLVFRERLPADLLPYAILREVHRLDLARQGEAARLVLAEAFAANPSPALALELARRDQARGETAAAVVALERGDFGADERAANWGLRAALARELETAGAGKAAVEGWKKLLMIDAIPPAPRLVWLREAWQTATATGLLDQATRWEAEIAGLGGSVNLPPRK